MLTATDDRLPRELADQTKNAGAPLLLTLPITDPIVLGYITQFDEDHHVEKAVEALKVGVIALKSASPTLDMRVVHDKFAEVMGDETELVRGTVGAVARSKQGDFVATLGETAGAPGLKIVVEVKESEWKLKDAVAAIDDAKKNREAAIGIFVFAKGSEPAEVGDFRRIGEDFYCTVDKSDLAAAKPLLFFDSAYKIARALAVAAARRQAAGGLDLEAIEQHVRELLGWVDRIGEMTTKARSIQSSGKFIEDRANELKGDLDRRLNEVLQVLARAK